MSLFARTQPDAVWLAGFSPDRATLEDFDRKVVAGLNGDDGGTYAPATPLVFDNTASGPGGIVRVTAPVKVCYGARLTTQFGARFRYAAGQFAELSPGHVGGSRTVVTACIGAAINPAYAANVVFERGAMQVGAPRWRTDLSEASFSFADGGTFTNFVFREQATRMMVLLRTCDGATLVSVTLTWVASLGTPRMRVVRLDADGNVVPLTLTAAGADPDGWVRASPPDAFVDEQTTLLPVDPGVVIDKSQYGYALAVEEDQRLGTVFPNLIAIKPPARLATTENIALTGLPIIDGVQTVIGDVILVRAQDDLPENGLWVVRGSALPFSLYSYVLVSGEGGIPTPGAAPGEYPKGYVVPVQQGATLGGTLWQMTSNDVGRFDISPQTFAPLAPMGNTYLACMAAHTGITDTRWQ